jgi:chorismate mutase
VPDNNKQNQLLQLRSKIDEIDNKIINLLNDRMQIIEEVAQFKKESGDKFFVRSAREADMIKNLVAKADKSIPKSTIVNIWRKIICSSNVLEQNLKIAIHNPNKLVDYQYLVREYYGDFVPLETHESFTNIIAGIESGEIQIGIFALPDNSDHKGENWWINMANNQNDIKVFAKIPFIGNSQHQLVAIAAKSSEPSNEDATLLVMEIDSQFSKNLVEEILGNCGLKLKILSSTKLPQIQNINFYLVEVEGFLESSSKEISKLSATEIRPFIKVLGHFPKPIL